MKRWTEAPLSLLVAVLSLTASCSDAGVRELRGFTMGTTYSIKFVGHAADLDAVGQAVESELEEVNALYSTYLDDSVVSRFNAARDVTVVHEVGDEFVALIALALRVADATDGAFDPTILPLTEIYPIRRPIVDRTTQLPDGPDERAVEEARARVGFRQLELVPPGGIRKRTADVRLDTNAFAKGHGVDRVADALVALGKRDFLVEIGGEVRCGGLKPGGTPWMVGVERPSPDGRRAVAQAVAVRDAALATSGGYRQFVDLATGERVHHIFDPATGGNPNTAVVSVSVRASTCALADALATALVVIGPERGAEVLKVLRAQIDESIGALFLMAAGEHRGSGDESEPDDATPRYESLGVGW